jgi:hypothetical protein
MFIVEYFYQLDCCYMFTAVSESRCVWELSETRDVNVTGLILGAKLLYRTKVYFTWTAFC